MKRENARHMNAVNNWVTLWLCLKRMHFALCQACCGQSPSSQPKRQQRCSTPPCFLQGLWCCPPATLQTYADRGTRLKLACALAHAAASCYIPGFGRRCSCCVPAAAMRRAHCRGPCRPAIKLGSFLNCMLVTVTFLLQQCCPKPLLRS